VSIFRLEVSRSPFSVAAPAIYVVATVFAVGSAHPRVASWTNVVFVLFNAQSFVVPLVAGVAAWSGLRAMRRRLAATENTSVRSRARIRMPQIAADASWVVAASLAMVTALVVRGCVIGLTGVPVPVSIAYGVAVSVLFVLVGHLASMLIEHWAAIPVAVAVPLGLYAANTFGIGSASVLALNPLYRFAHLDPYEPSVPFYVGQLLVLAGYCAVVVLALGLGGKSRSWFATGLVAVATVPAVVIGATLLQAHSSNAVIAREPKFFVARDAATGLEIEVLDLYRPVADELAAAWGRISALTAKSSLAFGSLEQDLDPRYEPKRPAGAFYRLDLNPNSPTLVESSVEKAFNDIVDCEPDGPSGTSDWWLSGNLVVRTWFEGLRSFPSNVVANDPDMQRALDAMHAMSTSDAADWVAEHADAFRTCDWHKSDFPLP